MTLLSRNHHRVLRAALAVVLAVMVGMATACSDDDSPAGTASPSPTVEETTQPNIILIVADDMAASDMEFMPNVQSLLVDQGTYLPNFIATDPSRATILRGQYPHNHGITTNTAPEGGFAGFTSKGLEESTVATWLQDAGYRTALVGKYVDGYPYTDAVGTAGDPSYIAPGWDEWYAPLGSAAYDQYNYEVNENGAIVSYGDAPEDFGGDVLARHATAVVSGGGSDLKPFFLYVAPLAPRYPAASAPRHDELFADATVPQKPSHSAISLADKPAYLSALPVLTAEQRQQIDGIYARRLRSLQSVDDMVGSIVEELTASGALDNTYIFFTSDNGYLLGEHRVPRGNGLPHEESIRVSLAVRGPGVPAGVVDQRLALTTDLAPTFAALADATAPAFVDGRPLLPLLGKPGDGAAWRRSVLLSFSSPPDGVSAEPPFPVIPPPYVGLRSDFSTYVQYATGERELYFNSEDPYQLTNAAGYETPSQAAVYASLVDLLKSCAGPTCIDAENVAPPP